MKQEVLGTMAGGNGRVKADKGLKFQRYFTGKVFLLMTRWNGNSAPHRS